MAYQALCNPGLGKFVDQAPGVSIWPQSTGVLFVFSISAYADPECDSKYYNLVKKIKSYTKTELADKVKKRYLTQLRIAYLLCKDGKKEQAAEVMAELREVHDFNTVFSTQDGNWHRLFFCSARTPVPGKPRGTYSGPDVDGDQPGMMKIYL